MNSMRHNLLPAAVLSVLTCMTGAPALAACNATVNGRPMTLMECAMAVQTYGQVVPGDYVMDDNGNWVNTNNPALSGNSYWDAQGTPGYGYPGGGYYDEGYPGSGYYDDGYPGGGYYGDGNSGGGYYGDGYSGGGSWGGGSNVSPSGVYDSSGGCEGGSCVNIID